MKINTHEISINTCDEMLNQLGGKLGFEFSGVKKEKVKMTAANTIVRHHKKQSCQGMPVTWTVGAHVACHHLKKKAIF